MATSRVQSCDMSNDQMKVLARHTHPIEDYAGDLTALTTRIVLPTHFVPPASVLKLGVKHEFRLPCLDLECAVLLGSHFWGLSLWSLSSPSTWSIESTVS